MVIAIGANGDGVPHWHHHVHHHWSQWIAIGSPFAQFFVAIGANGANGKNPKSL
jgi:hypothetical protein